MGLFLWTVGSINMNKTTIAYTNDTGREVLLVENTDKYIIDEIKVLYMLNL